MEGKGLKTGLFGYRKKSVKALLEEMNQEYTRQKEEKDRQIAELTRQNQILTEERSAALTKMKELEGEKEYISAAIVKAEREGCSIKEAATREADARKRQLELELSAQKEQLLLERESLLQIKQTVHALLQRYENEVGSLAQTIQGSREGSNGQ